MSTRFKTAIDFAIKSSTSLKKIGELVPLAMMTSFFDTTGLPTIVWCWGWFAQAEPISRLCLTLIVIAGAAILIAARKPNALEPPKPTPRQRMAKSKPGPKRTPKENLNPAEPRRSRREKQRQTKQTHVVGPNGRNSRVVETGANREKPGIWFYMI